MEYWIQGGPLTIIITGSDILLSSSSVTVNVLCRWEVIFTCKASVFFKSLSDVASDG